MISAVIDRRYSAEANSKWYEAQGMIIAEFANSGIILSRSRLKSIT